MSKTHNDSLHEIVTIEPYNPQWEILYSQEVKNLKSIFKDNVLGCEHYGSTAVAHMWAKPIIGILLGLPDWQISTRDLTNLMSLGYCSTIPCNLTNRTYLKKQAPHAFTLAITTYMSPMWFDHLIIRDYLRYHEHERIAYSMVKKEALERGFLTFEQYRNYKKTYLEALFERAKKWSCKNCP